MTEQRRLLIPPEIRRMNDGKLKLFVAGHEIAGVVAVVSQDDGSASMTTIAFNNAEVYFAVEKPDLNS